MFEKEIEFHFFPIDFSCFERFWGILGLVGGLKRLLWYLLDVFFIY
jgi:hypothetical protein